MTSNNVGVFLFLVLLCYATGSSDKLNVDTSSELRLDSENADKVDDERNRMITTREEDLLSIQQSPINWNYDALVAAPHHEILVRDENREYMLHWYETDFGNVTQGDILLESSFIEYLLAHDGHSPPKVDLLGLARFNGGGIWDCPIPYAIREDFPEKRKVHEAIAHLEEFTAWRFVEHSNEDYRIIFVPAGGCASYIGRVGFNTGEQDITIASGCETGAVVHEIMHAIGIYHEQSRPDREDYVQINYGNIQTNAEGNFDIANQQTIGVYDYGSLMHYGVLAFNNGGGNTIETLQPQEDTCYPVGNRVRMTETDTQTLEYRYPSAGGSREQCGGTSFPDWDPCGQFGSFEVCGGGNSFNGIYVLINGDTVNNREYYIRYPWNIGERFIKWSGSRWCFTVTSPSNGCVGSFSANVGDVASPDEAAWPNGISVSGCSGTPITHPCVPNRCQNDAVCTDAGNDEHSCACANAYAGDNCEIPDDDCSPNPCVNGGVCTDTGSNANVDDFECTCPEGFGGPTCADEPHPCDDLPCANDGQCVENGDDFTCDCAEGYTGPTCETIVDPCDDTPCANGGQCVPMGLAFSCVCVGDFTGPTCEQTVEPTSTAPTPTNLTTTDGVTTGDPTPTPTLAPEEILELTAASFDNTFGRIQCDFNLPVSIPSGLSCEHVVPNATLVLLGENPMCSFTSTTRMTIMLDTTATIHYTRDDIVLMNLASEAHPLILISRLSSALSPPDVFPSVNAVITGPSVVSDCSDVVFNSFVSSGSASRPFTYEWRIAGELQSETGPSLIVPRESIEGLSQLTIRLRITNWLGTSDQDEYTAEVSAESVPSISGLSSVTIRSQDPLTYKITVSSSCTNQSIVSYRWSSLSSDFNLTTLQQNGYEYLRIPPNVLEARRTYRFRVDVTTNQNTSSSHEFSVIVRAPDAVAVTSTQRTICVDETCDNLQLVGEDFFTTFDEVFSANARFVWSCSFTPDNNLEDVLPCIDDTMEDDVFGLRADPRSNVTLTTAHLRTLGSGVMTFRVSMFLSDEYVGMYGSHDDYVATFSVILLPVTGNEALNVEITPLEGLKVSAGEKVSLEAMVMYAGNDSSLQYQWRCLSDNFDLADPTLLKSDVNSSYLVLASNSLVPGADYTFEITVSLPDDSRSASASISFTTNFPPTGGLCGVITAGEAFVTPYSLGCSAWTDDAEDLPLQYRFILYSENDDRLAILSQWSELSSVETLLAPGRYSVVAQIRDNIGAASTTRVTIDVSANQNQSFSEFVEAAAAALEGATPEESLRLITTINAVLGELDGDGQTISTEEVQQLLFDALQKLVEDQQRTQTSDELEQLLLAVASFSDAGSLQSEMGDYINSIMDLVLNGEFAQDGVTEGIAEAALTALGQVGAVTTGSSLSASEFYQSFKDVLFQVSRGLVQNSLVGERGTVVETNALGFYARSSMSDDVDSRIEIGGITVDIPPSVLSDVGDDDVSNVVTSFVRLSTGSFFPTNGPGVSTDGAQSAMNSPQRQSLLASISNAVSNGFGLLNTDVENIESGDSTNEMFQAYREEASSLFSVSGTVYMTFYDASSSTIDTASQQELVVSDLSPCNAMTLNISHYDDSEIPSILVRPNGAATVCRQFDETTGQLEADCVTIAYTQEWTACNCTQTSAALDVGGWGDFVPSANVLAAEDSLSVTNDNVALHPSGIAAISVVLFLFIALVVYAVVHDRRMDYVDSASKEQGVVDIWKSRIRNDHKWLSIFLRKNRSRFETHERAIVLFVFILSTIAFSSVFHARIESGADALSALVADWFSVALVSGALSLLPSLFLSQMFKNTRPRNQSNSPQNDLPQAEGQSPDDRRCKPLRRFFSIWSTGILRGDEGIIDSPNMFAPWVNILNYVMAALWIGMCITLILVFNLRFNLEDQAPTFFYSECGRGFQLYNDMGDNTAWGLSFFLANVIDFLITQPLILLALAIYASWKPSKHENDGVHISHALENGGMKQIEGAQSTAAPMRPPPPPVAAMAGPMGAAPPPVPRSIPQTPSASNRAPPKPPSFRQSRDFSRQAPTPPAAPRFSGTTSPRTLAGNSDDFQSRAQKVLQNIQTVREDSPTQDSRVSSINHTPRASSVPVPPRNARMPVPGRPSRVPAPMPPTRSSISPPSRPTRSSIPAPSRPTRNPVPPSPASRGPPPVPRRW